MAYDSEMKSALALHFHITSTLYRFLILFEFEYFSRIIKCPSLKLKSFFWTSQKHILWLCFTLSRVSCNQSFVVTHAHSESLGVSCTIWIKSVILSLELNVIWINSCVLKMVKNAYFYSVVSARGLHAKTITNCVTSVVRFTNKWLSGVTSLGELEQKTNDLDVMVQKVQSE